MFVNVLARFPLIFIFGQHIHVNHLQGGRKPMSDCSGQEEISFGHVNLWHDLSVASILN